GNIGTNAGSRLAVSTPTLAADATNVFLSAGAVTLDTVNSLSNLAGTTYDLSSTGTITVTGGVSATNTYLVTNGGDITGLGTVSGTTEVALQASGNIGTNAGSR